MTFEPRLRSVEPRKLLLLASVSTACGLFFMVMPNFLKAPIFVLAGMSLGHLFGLLGVLLFAASVVREVLTHEKPVITADADSPEESKTS